MYDASNEDERTQIIEDCEDRINKAVALQFMAGTEGWEIVKDSLADLEQMQLDHLYQFTPGQEKEILAAHAVWFTTRRTKDLLYDAINEAIQSGEAARFDLARVIQPHQEEEIP